MHGRKYVFRFFFFSREVDRGVHLIAAATDRLVDFIDRGKVKLGEGKKEETKKKEIKIKK